VPLVTLVTVFAGSSGFGLFANFPAFIPTGKNMVPSSFTPFILCVFVESVLVDLHLNPPGKLSWITLVKTVDGLSPELSKWQRNFEIL